VCSYDALEGTLSDIVRIAMARVTDLLVVYCRWTDTRALCRVYDDSDASVNLVREVRVDQCGATGPCLEAAAARFAARRVAYATACLATVLPVEGVPELVSTFM